MTVETDKLETAPEGERTAKDAHLEKAMSERNAAKAKLREAETQLAEARAKVDAFEQEKLDRETEIARKAGEFGKIEDGYKSKLAAKEQELAEVNSRIAARERSDRENALVEAVASKAGIADRALVKGLFRVAADAGFDAAPAELGEALVAEAIERLRVLGPSLFTARSTPAANAGTTDTAGVPADIASDPRKLAAYNAGRALSPVSRRLSNQE